MWFGDFRGLIFNDGEFGSNMGSGYRWFVEDQNRIYGINGYWDTRKDNSLLFNQAGIGVESLGQIFDFRANGYTPAVYDSYQHQLGTAYFQDNRLFVASTAALSGMDAEAGVNLPTFNQISTGLFGGGYYYDSNHTIAAAGWRVRAEAMFRDFVVVGVSVQDDELFGQTVNGMIELRHTVFHRAILARRSMRHKFRDADGSSEGQTVRREVIIEALWAAGEDDIPNSRTIDVHVRRLRSKLGRYEDIVRTVRGAGYRFDRHADVTIHYGEAPSPDMI
jgi:hypothetical protein